MPTLIPTALSGLAGLIALAASNWATDPVLKGTLFVGAFAVYVSLLVFACFQDSKARDARRDDLTWQANVAQNMAKLGEDRRAEREAGPGLRRDALGLAADLRSLMPFRRFSRSYEFRVHSRDVHENEYRLGTIKIYHEGYGSEARRIVEGFKAKGISNDGSLEGLVDRGPNDEDEILQIAAGLERQAGKLDGAPV